MKTQKFFSVTIVFNNQKHLVCRYVLQLWLQFFFDTSLKGKDLSNLIGEKTIFITRAEQTHCERWWGKEFLVSKILNK